MARTGKSDRLCSYLSNDNECFSCLLSVLRLSRLVSCLIITHISGSVETVICIKHKKTIN